MRFCRFQFKVRASFLAATGYIKTAAAKIAVTKKQNKKRCGGFAFFGCFFGEAKK
jgi:hypothetical protein